jgi:hypothetical protein
MKFMLFAKLWGGRKDEGDEPARFSVPASSPPIIHSAATRTDQLRSMPTRSGPAKTGFDPYNSGSFERKNAWERIGKR